MNLMEMNKKAIFQGDKIPLPSTCKTLWLASMNQLEEDIAHAVVYHENQLLKEQMQDIHFRLFGMASQVKQPHRWSECA